eukprot:5094885-Ditylum_brightwellii.AAC.1
MLSEHYCSYPEKLGQHRVGVITQISRIIGSCKSVLTIVNTLQKRKIKLAANVVKRMGYRVSNSLPQFCKWAKS